jgi:hypothetical protein
MSDVPDHLKPLFHRLVSLPASQPPSPWREVAVHAVGGLTDVAFADSTDLLLVISSAGRGLFNCSSGERVARDPADDFDYDTSNLLASGIGSLESQRLRTAGLHGGGLAVTTADGWSLDLLTLSWPHHSLFITPPGHWLYGPAFSRPGNSTKITTDSEIRVFGFSPTGRAFIFATSSDLFVFNRSA